MLRESMCIKRTLITVILQLYCFVKRITYFKLPKIIKYINITLIAIVCYHFLKNSVCLLSPTFQLSLLYFTYFYF